MILLQPNYLCRFPFECKHLCFDRTFSNIFGKGWISNEMDVDNSSQMKFVDDRMGWREVINRWFYPHVLAE